MRNKKLIPFNLPFLTGNELKYINDSISRKKLSGDGFYTMKSSFFLEKIITSNKVLLTHSCTAALEIIAHLINIQIGDEIIMPSYTFVSTANAFVLRGGVPRFIDIRPDTLNIDESLIEQAINKKTKAIVVIHYAGVSCEMSKILKIAKKHNLFVIEDNAQGILSSYKNKPTGSFGDFSSLSFHETKNIISGEGGALSINNKKFIEKAEIIREKGTNRTSFLKGIVDKYTWYDIGSSYLPSEIISAFLWAQLQKVNSITQQRLRLWEYYRENLFELESKGIISLPKIPNQCKHNGHCFYIILKNNNRDKILKMLKKEKIICTSHYVPLHSSPGGRKFCKIGSRMIVTEKVSQNIIRLPIWVGLKKSDQERITDNIKKKLI